MIWHSSEYKEVLKYFEVDPKVGLSKEESKNRIYEYGKNTITRIEKPDFLKYFIKNLTLTPVIALIVLSVISFGISWIYNGSAPISVLLIIGVVILNALISAYHLYSSEKVLNSLNNRTDAICRCIRNGEVTNVKSSLLVPGDIIILSEGDFISADARLIEANEFRCNESALTGETVPVEKSADVVFEDIAPVNERKNMVFCGCNVVHGEAKAIVVATGLNSENGRCEAILQQTGKNTLPLEALLDKSGKIMNCIIFGICILYFILGIFRNFDSSRFASMTVDMLVETVALGVAAIPEALPMMSTLVISLGLERIIADNIIIKKTDAVQLLGQTTVICADKTGILTHHTMTLSKIYDGDIIVDPETEVLSEKSALVLKLAAACSTLSNDATEKTLNDACIKYNSMSEIDIENAFPRLGVIPFDSERKSMTTINMINGKPFAIVKGAPEILIEKCIGCDREKIQSLNDDMAKDGYRVICIGLRALDEIPSSPKAEEIENNLIFAGLLCLSDPPRNEAIAGIAACDNAGITTIMMTGDNALTASAIARRIGILKNGTQILTGTELSELSDQELYENIEKYSVYARISPADKVRIIKAWQQRGEIVTVTGDGVEDAVALSTADIGCAVGKNGTDVARGNADTIITNNSFLSVVSAVKESRGLFENIRKSVFFLLSCNFGEVLVFLLSMIFFGVAPMNAVQLLWINLLTDCAPTLSLSLEKAEENVIKHKPKALSGRLFHKRSIIAGAAYAIFIALMTLITFTVGKKIGVSHAMTMSFTTLGLIQIFHSYNLKTSDSIFKSFKKVFTTNSFMNISNALAIFAIVFLGFTPVGIPFGLTVLSIKRFSVCLILSILIIPFGEIIKLIQKSISK